jgi:diaminopimelate epimerase
MRAERWQAAGNVYLLIEGDGPFDAGALCAAGRADGILVLGPSARADVALRILNPDGSAAEACGNGTRMVARYVAERDGHADVTIETVAGLLAAHLRADGRVRAALAPARLANPAQYLADAAGSVGHAHRFVSVGNPHLVLRVDDVTSFPLTTEGPRLETHACVPERANVEIWQTRADGGVDMRACGSGACAVAVAAVLDGAAVSPVAVHLPGGRLEVEVGPDLQVTMTGSAERLEVLEL